MESKEGLMKKYYFTETPHINIHLFSENFELILAKNDKQAKALASRRKVFQGTVLQLFTSKHEESRIGIKYDNNLWQK